MKKELEQQIAAVVEAEFGQPSKIELTRPEEQYGDYATNVALKLAKPLGKNPREVAEILAAKLKEVLADQVSEVSVAGPGFINLRLTDTVLVNSMSLQPERSLEGQ